MTKPHGPARPPSVEDSLGLSSAQRKKEQVRRRRRRLPAIESAGALVWRDQAGTLEVLLVHRPSYDDWSWPKGKVDLGESAPAAAVREVAEETGTPVVLGLPLPRLEYLTRAGYRKRVHYWAARQVAPECAVVGAREPVDDVDEEEIDAQQWVAADHAAGVLTWADDIVPLTALISAWDQGWLTAAPVVIARHANARRRASWSRGEDTRPLSPKGYLDAARLLPVLSAYGIDHVISSPWRRCLDTSTPYAHALGVEPELAPELTEDAHREHPKQVHKLIAATLSSGVATVVCTHRPVLKTVLAELLEAVRKPLRPVVPTKNPYLTAGSLLVNHVVQGEKGPRIVAAELVNPRRSGMRVRTLTA